jgi:hypothetical protein
LNGGSGHGDVSGNVRGYEENIFAALDGFGDEKLLVFSPRELRHKRRFLIFLRRVGLAGLLQHALD